MRKAIALCILLMLVSVLLAETALPSGVAIASPSWPPYRTVKGAQTVIVITVEFPDSRHATSAGYLEDLIFRKIDGYYREVSYNQCWIVGNVTKRWYQMSKSSAAYEWDGKSNVQTYMNPFVQEAIRLADDEVDYSNYRFIAIVHSARWRNAWGFMAAQNINSREGTYTVNVAIISEHHSESVFAHEFGHILGGLPDMYGIVDGQYLPIFVGPWDLMSQTGGYIQHFSAWSKIKLGWIPFHAIVTAPRKRAITVTIDPLEVPSSGTLALTIPLKAGTYYIVEVRERIGFDRYLPDYGVLIYFVDETKTKWGESPLMVQDGNPNTSTFDDAAFDLRAGKRSAFFDPKNDISIVIVGRERSSYTIFVGSVSQGEAIMREREKASAAIKAMDEANMSIQRAAAEGRMEGLDVARSLLSNASIAFAKGNYSAAVMLAKRAKESADAAVPPQYPRTIRVSDHFTCRSVSSHGEWRDKTDRFNTTDQAVYIWCYLEDLTIGKTYYLRYVWINPRNETYATIEGNFTAMPYPSRRAWACIYIKGHKPEGLPGEWRCEVYYREEGGEWAHAFTERFAIQGPPQGLPAGAGGLIGLIAIAIAIIALALMIKWAKGEPYISTALAKAGKAMAVVGLLAFAPSFALLIPEVSRSLALSAGTIEGLRALFLLGLALLIAGVAIYGLARRTFYSGLQGFLMSRRGPVGFGELVERFGIEEGDIERIALRLNARRGFKGRITVDPERREVGYSG